MEQCAAVRAGERDVVGREVFFSDDGGLENGRAVTTAGRLAGAVLGPEGVDDFGAFPPVAVALVGRHVDGVDVDRFTGLDIDPAPLMSARAGGGIEGLDLGLDLLLDVGEEGAHLLGVAAGQLILDHEPRDRVEVHTGHLHAEARAFDQSGASAHETVQHLEVLERACFLVVAVVMVPDPFGGLVGVVRRFGAGGDEHGTENAGASARPPFRHLVDRLAGVAFEIREGVDLGDGEVGFQAGELALRVGKIGHGKTNRLAQFLGQEVGLGLGLDGGAFRALAGSRHRRLRQQFFKGVVTHWAIPDRRPANPTFQRPLAGFPQPPHISPACRIRPCSASAGVGVALRQTSQTPVQRTSSS